MFVKYYLYKKLTQECDFKRRPNRSSIPDNGHLTIDMEYKYVIWI